MRFSVVSVLALLPAFALGQDPAYLQSVLGALTAANLTSLVSVASAVANTTDGMALLTQLAVGNKTVFAPSNKAFANVSTSVSMNATLLTEILAYHILNNTYTINGTMVAPAHTIARTGLNFGGYALPGNHSAPLVLSRNTSDAMSFQINQAADNVSVTGPASAGNLQVYIIDEVLSLPPNLSTIATSLFPSLAGLITQTGLLAPLAASPGITVFAPNNAAVAAVMSAVGMLNSTQITSVLANHVINGSVVYSTGLAMGTYTSAGGEPFMFTSNSSGSYVMSANTTARIIQSDIIMQNGVVHLIDQVLVNPTADPTAAASAYSSGIAAAATSTDPTGAVTATSQPAATDTSGVGSTGNGAGSDTGAGDGTGSGAAGGTAGGAGGQGSGSDSGSGTASGATTAAAVASAGKMQPFGFSASMLGGLVAVVGVIMGGGLILM